MELIKLREAFKGLNQADKFDLYRRLWGRAAAFEALTDFPLHLDIESSGLCNLKCAACFQNGCITTGLGLMSLELFERVLAEGVPRGLCAIKLQVRGEPFMHPQLMEMIGRPSRRACWTCS